MKRILNRDSAFTLIELMIVTAIVPIIAVSMYAFVIKLNDAGDYLASRTDALEQGQRAIRIWRTDVEFSSRCTIDPEGQGMTVWRHDAAGGEYSIEYTFAQAGELIRRDETKEIEERLCVGLAASRFGQSGRASRIDLEFRSSDGLRNREWDMAAFATPLSAYGGMLQ
jgi:prepilin-type N-terminal cleavage/methylation domain-containing protein